MSIKIMNAVWASGPEDHTGLLVLLAMADIADDNGILWPSVATIATKSRMSERNARRVIRILEANGWVETNINRGRNHTSSYRINTDKITGQDNRTNWPGGQMVTENRTKPAVKPDIAVSPEPSGTIIEPSIEEIGEPISRRPTENLAPCIDHFNATAARVGWPQVQRLTDARRAALSHRITDCGGQEAWRDAIDRAAASPLLTGQTGRGWRADFDWLCKAANFTKLMEGNYDPRPDHIIPAHQRGPGGAHDSMVAAFAGVARRQ